MKYVNKSEIFNQLKGQEELPDLKPTYKNVFYSFFSNSMTQASFKSGEQHQRSYCLKILVY